jgi:D-serine deaminase-like pyridoxal phosphate-dependent protein
VNVGFETALWCLASVISARPGHAVLNAGMKELYGEDGMPRLALAGADLEDGLSDEHATVLLSPETVLVPGDRMLLAPRHVDPTLNLHPHLFVCNGGNVERWNVDGRIR